jgi:hypothetical protein
VHGVQQNIIREYVQRYGHWNWRELPKFAGIYETEFFFLLLLFFMKIGKLICFYLTGVSM